MITRGVFTLACLCAIVPLSAQWKKPPNPKIPRTADGKPNLSAPAPKQSDGKPDLSGVWLVADNHLQFNLAADSPGVMLKPLFTAIYQRHLDGVGKDRPSGKCLPHGVPDAMLPPTPFKFIHTPEATLILYEEFVDFRQIFTDGRELPEEPTPAWFGYSVGKWDGNTFVVDTRGFNDKSWLDDDGHPHSEALHTIERFRRLDVGHLNMEITIDDPQAYTTPWSATIRFNLLPDAELAEFVCENNKDLPHLVGK